MHQAVDVARQADEDTEIGDRLDLARHAIATVVVLSELSPRIGLALLEAQRDTTTLFVDVQHHDLDLFAGLYDLRGVDVLVGPVHFGHVHQALDAVFDFDEGAIIGDVGDLAEHMRVGRITAGDVLPRIGAQLLEAQRYARTLAIELQDAHIDFGADLHDFRRMLDALPRHVGDVQQAIDAAEVDERTVIGEVLDHAAHHCAFLQIVHERIALGRELLFDHRTTRHHNVVALLVELDDLELERLAFQVGGVAHGAHIDQRTGEEGADVFEFDGEAALDPAGDDAGDDFLIGEGFLEARPGAGTLGLFARQAGFAGAVFDGIPGDLNLIAGLDFEFTAFIAELLDGDIGFGLQSDVHEHHVVADIDDQTHQDHSRPDALVGQALFEQIAK